MYSSNNGKEGKPKKKAPKNAFYYFMISFKDEQAKKGITYKNMTEVAEAAGSIWPGLPPSEKAIYNEILKQEKQKSKVSNEKYTSTGEPLSLIQQREKEIQEAIELEDKNTTELVNLEVCNDSLKTMDIYIMDVNCYFNVDDSFYVGETTLLRFNIQDGIKDTYHTFVNPAHIPKGYTSQIKYGCETLGLIMPDQKTHKDYLKVLAHIIDYLKAHNPTEKQLPPIFTIKDKTKAVQDFIYKMCQYAGEDDNIFHIYKLDLLFYKIINALSTMPSEGFPKESLASMELKKDSFMYTPGLACEHHEKIDRSVECTQSRVKRWAYSVLDRCCPVAGVRAVPGRHVPPDFDLDSIHIYQEQKNVRIAPSVANLSRAMSSCNTSENDYPFREPTTSAYSTVDNTKRETEKRVHVPQRMPESDYSQTIRVAPDLTESEFPPLGALRAGRGRGRGGASDRMSGKWGK